MNKTMNSAEGLKRLSDLYFNKDWYHSVGLDAYGRYVVYVKFMNHETLNDIPNLDGKQVLVHFAASLPSAVDKFINKPDLSALPMPPDYVNNFIQKAKTAQIIGIDIGLGQLVNQVTLSILNDANMSLVEAGFTTEKDELVLQTEIENLQTVWGAEAVENVFYEIVDGDDAVTNVSVSCPGLRRDLDILYKQYGFNLVCEKLDN